MYSCFVIFELSTVATYPADHGFRINSTIPIAMITTAASIPIIKPFGVFFTFTFSKGNRSPFIYLLDISFESSSLPNTTGTIIFNYSEYCNLIMSCNKILIFAKIALPLLLLSLNDIYGLLLALNIIFLGYLSISIPKYNDTDFADLLN